LEQLAKDHQDTSEYKNIVVIVMGSCLAGKTRSNPLYTGMCCCIPLGCTDCTI